MNKLQDVSENHTNEPLKLKDSLWLLLLPQTLPQFPAAALWTKSKRPAMVIKDLGDPALPSNFSKLNKCSHLYLGPGSVITFVPAEYNLQCLFPTRFKGNVDMPVGSRLCRSGTAPLHLERYLTTTGILGEVGYRSLRAEMCQEISYLMQLSYILGCLIPAPGLL